MSTVKFIGCLHLGHKPIAQYRGFHDEFYHDEYLINQWNNSVSKRDLVYILGDITFETSKDYNKLNRLNGRKKVVLGNHDLMNDVPELLKHVEGVSGAIDYKGYILTHVPIHIDEIHFYKANLHCHIHHENKLTNYKSWSQYKDQNSIKKTTKNKYWNCDALLLNFVPKTIEELKSIYNSNNK